MGSVLAMMLLLCGTATADQPDPPPTEEPGDAPTEDPASPVPPTADEPGVEPSAEPVEDPATEPALPPSEEPVDRSFSGTLERAKMVYSEGGHTEAVELLTRLTERIEAGEEVHADDVAATYIYLGEIQYKTGDTSMAWDSFKTLLERDPTRQISPYYHPTDVIGWFEMVRRQVMQEAGPTVPPPPETIERMPAWGYAPFGIPQFRQGRPGRAAFYGTSQAVLGGASIGSWLYLEGLNQGDPETQTEEEFNAMINTRRLFVQWPATFGFYAAWLASHLEARERWSAEQGPDLKVGLMPSPEGATVLVGGSF